jgi:menaquinone-9 beta-reductase
MPTSGYDLLTIGGGLGGAALALVMARAGARVLVLERQPKFRDRVRGEFLPPWGVAEAQQLVIADLLRQSGHNVPQRRPACKMTQNP